MTKNIPLILNSTLVAFAMLLAMLTCLEIGHRMGRSTPGGDPPDSGVVNAAVFALLGLLIAFTFSGAAERLDKRRTLIVDEANAIGTAYARLALLPLPARDELRAAFRGYVDTRLAVYDAIPDLAAAQSKLAIANRQLQAIWDKAIVATQGSQPATMLLLPAINSMGDISTTRTAAAFTHPPEVIYGLLFVLALVSALLAGRAMSSQRGRPWMHSILFVVAMTAAVYVIVDMEYPRIGLISVGAFDSILLDVRKSMQ